MSEERPPSPGPSESRPKAPRWAWWIATGFGSGFLRPASGTWGSLAALLAWALFVLAAAAPLATWAMGRPWGRLVQGTLIAAELVWLGLLAGLIGLAVRASDLVIQETGDQDPGYIVIDEWAGLWIALHPVHWLAAGHAGNLASFQGLVTFALLVAPGFILFRLFDIWKPWPCHEIQDLPGGQGIVADDVVAGLYAAVVGGALAKVVLPRLFLG